ncbi:hypothetical protein V5N34_36910 [Streptomyces baarnensis]|uniref:hypothetical protein n=1 Tax=Streptomyces TaxID=1883 RepID=UPI0029A6EF05|nr:hypothetical protein [Streptomyces sp. ME02-6979.5a]MDX3343782.1 hypothetical protein [Streptomyces sp. ME02-6979.5a]
MATEPLRYAADITPDDVDAVTDFLMGVLNGPSLKVGTHEYRTTAALRGLVPGFAGSLGYEFGDEVVAKAQEDERKKLSRIQNIRSTWNKLVEVASEWKGDDGFDTERWQTVRFYDAEDEKKFRRWEEKEKGTAAESAPFVSEYRVPGPRGGGEYVVARDPENANLWAVFEGTAQARHWDGTAWQHARFTGTGPYLFTRAAALALAHQHAELDVADEETSR